MLKIFTGERVVCAVLVVDGAFKQLKIKNQVQVKTRREFFTFSGSTSVFAERLRLMEKLLHLVGEYSKFSQCGGRRIAGGIQFLIWVSGSLGHEHVWLASVLE